MELSQAITLLQGANLPQDNPALWADLGCGTGLFTYALAYLLPAGSRIYAIDKAAVPLNELPHPAQVSIHWQQLDFVTQPLPFPGLDGLLLANSLHFVEDKPACIAKLSQSLLPQGRLLLVEYDTDRPNAWVPYPVAYRALPQLFIPLGFTSITKLHERPSRYSRANLYAALISK
jgi:trans-aconitate methyltransferase